MVLRRGLASAAALVFVQFVFVTQDHASAAPPTGLTKVRSEGFSPGRGPTGRLKAIEDGERDALGLYVRNLVGYENTALLHSLTATPHAYVHSSRVLGSEEVNGGTRVFLEVYLDESALRRDATGHVLASGFELPRVVILFTETVVGENLYSVAPAGIVESFLAETFRDRGFDVVSAETLRRDYTTGELLARLEGDSEMGGRFGRENRARVVVLGDVVSEVTGEEAGGALFRVGATLRLRILDAADGRVLATIKSEATVHSAVPSDGARQAIRDAAHKVRQEAVETVALVGLGAPPAEDIRLQVEGVRRGPQGEKVFGRVASAPGAGPVERLRHAGGVLLLQFPYEGKLSALVNYLVGEGPESTRLEVVRVVGRDMAFRLLTD